LASAINVTVPEPSSSAPLLMMSPGRGVGRVWPAAATGDRVATIAEGELLVTNVVVVRAEQDVGVPERGIAALDQADDVAGEASLDDVVGRVHVDGDRDAGQRDIRQRFLFLGGCAERRVVGA
jgi:hypothetical protein